MTPLGVHLRRLREERGITQKDMAEGMGVSAAYLSALEHGHRGAPSFDMLQRITGYLNVIWDDAEELQRVAALSSPRITIDTIAMSALATELANLFAQKIGSMSDTDMLHFLERLNQIGSKDRP